MLSRIFLGYDPISKQFKVLCMTSSGRDERLNTHQVLTLKTGKRLWRTIEHKFHFIENGSGEVCINCVLYFGARFGPSSGIVCFDVRSEKFGFINTNEDMGVGYLTLFNYKGKLGIHDMGNIFVDEDHLVLWVLEDAGNHKWSKHVYELPPLLIETRFVGMTSTGETVWLSYKEYCSNLYYVFFYNFERKTLTRVNLQGFEESNHDHHILDTFVDYVENMKFM